MIGRNVRILGIVTAVGSATVGGVFFAFSTFVMQALRRLPDREGLAAMQAINRAAPSPLFMTALFGTAVAGVGLGAVAVRNREAAWSTWMLAGGAVYLLGIVVTVAYHVPRNDALALIDPASAGAAAAWRRYAAAWTTWNHVRSFTSIAAAVLLMIGSAAD